MKTRITIDIESSKIKRFMQDGDDFREDMEREWHDVIYKIIEDKIQSDDFENNVMEEWTMGSFEYLKPKASEFSDVGNLMIKIGHEVIEPQKRVVQF